MVYILKVQFPAGETGLVLPDCSSVTTQLLQNSHSHYNYKVRGKVKLCRIIVKTSSFYKILRLLIARQQYSGRSIERNLPPASHLSKIENFAQKRSPTSYGTIQRSISSCQ